MKSDNSKRSPPLSPVRLTTPRPFSFAASAARITFFEVPEVLIQIIDPLISA